MRKLTPAELNRISTGVFRSGEKMPVVLVLDNIRSLQNVGSVFRTSDAFRVEKICLCGITATPPHREIHRAALGATESVAWSYYPTVTDAVNELIMNNYRIIGVEQTDASIPLEQFEPEPGFCYALIFGNEINGLSDPVLPLLDACIEIPQFGTKHSFNVAVSAGIVLWHFFLKTKPTLL